MCEDTEIKSFESGSHLIHLQNKRKKNVVPGTKSEPHLCGLPLPRLLSPCRPPHTCVVFCFSSLGESGMRSSSFVSLVEWLGFIEGSSGPGGLCRGGRVAHRLLPLERGSCGGGPFSTNSSLEVWGFGASGDCGDDDTGVCGGENGLGEADEEEGKGTRAARVDFC